MFFLCISRWCLFHWFWCGWHRQGRENALLIPPPRHPPFYYRYWRFILNLSRPFSVPATRRAFSGCNFWSSYKPQVESPMGDHYVGIGCRNLLDIGCHKSLLLVIIITSTYGQHCGAWSTSAKYISGQQQWSLTDRISFIRRTRMRRSLFFKI